MSRKDRIKFKLMEDGHIRAFQADTSDKRGVSELQIYPPRSVSPTITVAHTPLILVTDEAIAHYLRRSLTRKRRDQHTAL